MKMLEHILGQWEQEMQDLRHDLHRHPELGMKEIRTTALIKEKLQEYGVEIEEIGLNTGVSAIIRGAFPGRTIAIRGDIDALPMKEISGVEYASETEEACHSCGHDIHTTIALFCARVLNEFRGSLHGNIRFLFQPAEELGSGALYMKDHGVMTREPRPDQVLGFHVDSCVDLGKMGFIKGASTSASDRVKITVRGKGGHGAQPQRAVDPVVVAAMLLVQLQTLVSREVSPFDPVVLTFGSLHGGEADNVIPSEAVLRGTLRSYNPQTRKDLHEAIRRSARGLCESMRAHADVEIICGAPCLINDPVMIDGLIKATQETLGDEAVEMLEFPSPGSDDFAYYLENVPGVRFKLGTGTEVPASRLICHNPGIVFDDGIISKGVMVVCQYILNYLCVGGCNNV